MRIFAKDLARRGLGYWLPRQGLIGAGMAALLLLSIAKSGGDAIERDTGVPAMAFVVLVAGMGVSSGIIVGILNPWIASRLASSVVWALAFLPMIAAVSWFQLGALGKLTVFNCVVTSLVSAAIVGGLYGAIRFTAIAD